MKFRILWKESLISDGQHYHQMSWGLNKMNIGLTPLVLLLFCHAMLQANFIKLIYRFSCSIMS
jgi:hypothetical protein